MIGKVFGRLTVIELVGKTSKRELLYQCKCVCGNIRTITGCSLRAGHSKSCGCLRDEKSRERWVTHGNSNHPLYRTWFDMLQRCYAPDHDSYKYYGGRGITVDPTWADSFTQFATDMGTKPTGYELDRIDNARGYSRDNCRWVSHTENQRNTRFNRHISINNVSKCVGEWAEISGVDRNVIYSRLNLGWEPERAVFTAKRGSK